MAKNELVIKAKLDESQFEQEAEQMARTMDKMYERSYASANNMRQQNVLDKNLQSIGLKPTGNANANFQDATKVGMAKFREEITAQAQFIKQQETTYQKREVALQKMVDKQSQMVKGSKEELALNERITKQKENQQKLEQDILERRSRVNKAFETRAAGEQTTGGKMVEGFANGGLRGAAKTGIEAVGGAEAVLGLGVAGAAVYAIRQITNVAESIVKEIASVNRVTMAAAGSAISGSTGNYLGEVYSGRSVFESGNMGERSRALRNAQTEENRLRTKDTVMAGDTGALPMGLGNSPEIGAAGLGYGALNAVFGDDMAKSRFMGRFSSSQMEKYNAQSMARMVGNYNQNFESEKAADPMKQLALQNYEHTYNRNLGVQRTLGLSDEQMLGSNGYMKQFAGKYTQEQGLGATQNILAAGGSTAMAAHPMDSLQAQKNFDLTNADQIFGKLSNNYGQDTNKSKAVLIDLLAEGTRIGLNKSEFREEQRKFTEAAAGFLAKGYVGTDQDSARLADMYGGGLVSKSGVGLNAANNTAEMINNIAGQGTGTEGAMGIASIMSSKIGRKLGSLSQQALNTMPLNQATQYNTEIGAMASEANATPQQIIELKMQSAKDKMLRNKEMQTELDAAEEARDSNPEYAGKSRAEISKMGQRDKKAKALADRLGRVGVYLSQSFDIHDENQIDSLSAGIHHLGNQKYKTPGNIYDLMNKQMNGGSTRVGDVTNEAVSVDQARVTDKSHEMLGDFANMAENTKTMSNDMFQTMLRVQELANQLRGLAGPAFEKELNRRTEGLAAAMDKVTVKPSQPTNQAQGGKPSGK